MSWRMQWQQFKQRMGMASEDDTKRPGEGRPPYSPYPLPKPEDEDMVIGDDDVGLVRNPPHLPGLSGVMVRGNGAIELFAGPDAGIRIDPNGAITIIGKRINLFSSGELHLKTAQHGLVWNDVVPFYKRMLHGTTATAMPVTVFPHAPQETALGLLSGNIATSILVAKEKSLADTDRSLLSWLARGMQ